MKRTIGYVDLSASEVKRIKLVNFIDGEWICFNASTNKKLAEIFVKDRNTKTAFRTKIDRAKVYRIILEVVELWE